MKLRLNQPLAGINYDIIYLRMQRCSLKDDVLSIGLCSEHIIITVNHECHAMVSYEIVCKVLPDNIKTIMYV